MGGKSLKREREQSRKETDTGKPAKRRRHGDDLMLAKFYDDLAAESDETRLKATKEIVVQFLPENEPTAQALEKALNRLIRGLCSNRKAARLGFCVTLTELLRQVLGQTKKYIHDFNLDVNGIIELIVEKTKVEGNVSGKERRDHLIGKVFGFKTVLQSGILIEPHLSIESWNKILDHILGMARDIPWLREECGKILIDSVKSLTGRPALRSCAQELIQRLKIFNMVNTPEGVAIWLTVQNLIEDVIPAGIWHDKDPLSRKERTRLAKILKEDFRKESGDGDDEAIKSAAANPNPIFAWDVVLTEILRRDESVKDDKEETTKREFPQFWLDTVDNNLFSATASHERKSWGFKLFTTLVATVPKRTLPSLFSPNFMRSLINQSKKDVRFLHAAALAALKAVENRAQQSSGSAISIFVAMTSKYGTIDLDKMTKTKTLENIILSADDAALTKIVRHLQSLILRPDSQEQATADSRRQTIADMLLNIIKNYPRYKSGSLDTVEGQDNWLRQTLDILIEGAHFMPTKSAKTTKVPLPPISDSSRKMFQERLSSCLTRLLGVETDSRASFALLAVGMIRSKATSSKTLELVFKADEPVLKTVERAFQTMDAIATKGSISGNKSAAEGFVLLYSLALLQVYNGDGDAILLLDDLDSSHQSLLKAKKTSPTQGQDAFVEIILTFLNNPHTLFKKIAQEAFAIFSPNITSEGLQSLIDILDTAENIEGQRELFEQGDAADIAGSEDDVEDVEDMSDVEMVDGELVKSRESDTDDSDAVSGSDSESGDDDSSEEATSDDEEDDEELRQFNDKLALTLQTSKLSANGTGSDESSDDEDMDDEQMMALDPHLTKIFQERSKLSSKKKQREDAKQSVVQFKSRVLDLLAMLMDKEYSNPLTLEVLLPLLRRTRAGENKQLTDKTSKILRTYTDARVHHKAPLPKPNNLEAVWEILKGIHEEANLGGRSSVHATACSNASLHVVKILVGVDKSNYSGAVDIYAETQKRWFMDKKSAIQPVLFTQFQTWSVSVHTQGR